MSKLGKLTRDQWKGLFTIAFAFISRFFITALLEPFFPPEGRKHGVSISLNGMIMSTTFVVTLFTSSAVGMLVAFYGPRRIIMVGTAINVASMISFGFLQFLDSSVAFTTLSFVLIGIHAFGSVCVSISAVTMGAKLFPDNISLIIGSAEFCVAVGETISLLTSGVIYDVGGFYLPFLLFSLIHAFSIPMAHFMLPSEEPVESVGKAEGHDEVKIRPWHLLKIPRTMIIALLLPLNGACWAFQGANLEEHLSPLQLTKTQVNLMFLLTSATYGAVSPIIGWMADKLERKWPPISIGLIGAGIGMMSLGPLPLFGIQNTVAQNVVVLTLVSVLLAVCTVPGFQAIILYTIEAGHENDVATYAVAQSLISTTDPIGNFGGSFGGGFLVENFGFPVASAIVGGAMAGAGTIIGSFFIFCDKKSTRAIQQVAQHYNMENRNC